MSVYLKKKRKWWEYYFRFQKRKYIRAGFKRKKDALAAEAEKKKEVKQPKKNQEETDMDFLTLLNRRLDYLEAYRSKKHYEDSVYMAKRWTKQWREKATDEISPVMISVTRHVISEILANNLRNLKFFKSNFHATSLDFVIRILYPVN